MITVPIIFREFRLAARRKRTFVLRCGLAGVLTVLSLLFVAQQTIGRVQPAMGLYLLSAIGWITVSVVLLLGPSLTSACIAEEKQEGTLGLLFLTHLNAADIILGKWMGKGFPLLMLALSATPFYFLPILFGGVGQEQAIGVVCSVFSALVLTLSVGICCSTFASATHAAQVAAYLVAFVVAIVPVLVAGRQFDLLELFGGGLAVSVPPDLALFSPLHGIVARRCAARRRRWAASWRA